MRAFWRLERDPAGAEYVRSPDLELHTLVEQGHLVGDCDDAATLAAALLAALSWPVELVAVRIRGDVEYSHVFARPAAWRDIDPIVPAEFLPIPDVDEEMRISVRKAP